MNLAAKCVLMAGAAMGFAAAAPAEFEVASIKQLDKPIEPGSNDLSFLGTAGKPIKINGNRVTITGTFRTLIAAAYDVKDYQVSGAPAWATSLVYAMTAKTAGEAAATQDQARPMLQALLADRFQLKLRHETKDLPVYHLTQVKKSANFKVAGADESFTWNVSQASGGMMLSKATKEPMVDFIHLVTVSTDRPVVDKTGIAGDIDYQILISQEGVKTPDDMNRAIVDAVKDQLGFKLESAKDAVELLVVERAEKASEN